MLLLTLTGLAGMFLAGRGAYVSIVHHDDLEGTLLIVCGILTIVVTAMLTQAVSP